jgi:hypothetical protein
MAKYGLYGKEKYTIMGHKKSPNNTIPIYYMAIYGNCHYFFGTPVWLNTFPSR